MSLIRAALLSVTVPALTQGAFAQGAANEATTFVVRVENVSEGEVLAPIRSSPAGSVSPATASSAWPRPGIRRGW
jgi:hypothetical protein